MKWAHADAGRKAYLLAEGVIKELFKVHAALSLPRARRATLVEGASGPGPQAPSS